MMLDLLAQVQPVINAASPTSQPAEVPFWVNLVRNPLIPFGALMIVVMMFMSKNKKKQEAEKQAVLENVKKNDQIETIGGIIGTVVSTDEKTITLKIDENANVKMKFNRRAIHRVITDDKSEKK